MQSFVPSGIITIRCSRKANNAQIVLKTGRSITIGRSVDLEGYFFFKPVIFSFIANTDGFVQFEC